MEMYSGWEPRTYGSTLCGRKPRLTNKKLLVGVEHPGNRATFPECHGMIMKIKAVHIFLMVLASFNCVLDAQAQERLNTNQEAKQILESAKQAIDRFHRGACASSEERDSHRLLSSK